MSARSITLATGSPGDSPMTAFATRPVRLSMRRLAGRQSVDAGAAGGSSQRSNQAFASAEERAASSPSNP